MCLCQPITIHRPQSNHITSPQEKQWLIQAPAEPANCCSGRKSVRDAQTRPTHTSTRALKHTGWQAHTLHTHAWTHTFAHGHKKHLHAQIRRQELRKSGRLQTHPGEGYSKWTSQPSGALTSIRHAYAARLPTDSESHLSARASAKQFQKRGKPVFMHICMHSEPQQQGCWLSSRSSRRVVYCTVNWFVPTEWLFLAAIV